MKLLEQYGATALRRAIIEALQRGTPRASSVAFLLRRQPRSTPLSLDRNSLAPLSPSRGGYNINGMDEAELENLNISLVKEWCKSEHVESPDATAAFNDGRGVFDVSSQARKLDEFISKHGLQNQVRRSSLAALLDNGTVHFAFKSKPN